MIEFSELVEEETDDIEVVVLSIRACKPWVYNERGFRERVQRQGGMGTVLLYLPNPIHLFKR